MMEVWVWQKGWTEHPVWRRMGRWDALGFITLFFGIGQAVGPALAGRMADATGSFTTAYALATVVAVLGALGAATLRPTTAATRG
jgi:hypothetical protein